MEFDDSPVMAACVSLAPAHTLFHHAAYVTQPGAPQLPLYAYCAVGWLKGQFVAPAVRIDADVRQDHDQYDFRDVKQDARTLLKRYPDNRLVHHLVDNCAFQYGCPAARNFILGRWEMPLPTARKCNSRCFGCISEQPKDGFRIAQPRLGIVPTPEEIAQITVPHFLKAERPVASFGQGCEGEPLTNPPLLEKAIRLIRSQTAAGTINLNTNGSRPKVIAKLFEAGLDSIRVSVNSFTPDWYNLYYQPRGYSFEDVLESIRTSHRMGKFASINYLSFPGVTDTESEAEALLEALEDTRPNMIQWRNLNIDPEEYLRLLKPQGKCLGIPEVMRLVRERFPEIRFGYFNPFLGAVPKITFSTGT